MPSGTGGTVSRMTPSGWRPMKAIVSAVFLLLASACGLGTEAGVGEDFTLAPGGVTAVTEAGAAVRFDSVAADSRCPSNVVCVWAGNAAIAITIIRSTTSADHVAINTGIAPRSVPLGGYVLEVVRLEPVPLAGQSIPAQDYRLTLHVRQP